MLKICGVDLTQKRSSSQRSRLKNQILTALIQLEDVYGIGVHDPNGVRQKYIPWSDWKGRSAHFSPPEEIDGLLLRQEDPKPNLPDVPAENWTSSQIERLRKEILGGPPEWTQGDLADKLGCTKQYVSQLERGKKNNPSREIRETLTRLYHRHK
jgi:DNA-binding XRE family transcriptional regulator